jgi:hypothetical protein
MNVTQLFSSSFSRRVVILASFGWAWNGWADEPPVPGPKVVPVPLRPAGGQRDWVESWIFSGQTGENARLQLENTAQQRIALVREKCGLDEAQTAKLQLASHGDICRFFREIDVVRKRLGVRTADHRLMNAAAAEIIPLQQKWNSGLFGAQSLVAGALKTTLTAEQKQRLLGEKQRQRDESHRFLAMAAIQTVERSIPLTQKQREALLHLVLQHMPTEAVLPNFESYLAFIALIRIEDEALKSFLDPPQLATFGQLQVHWNNNLPRVDQIKRVGGGSTEENWWDVIR